MTTSAPAPAPSPPRATATPFITSADQAGAFAFVREYFRRLDEAYVSVDPSGLTPLRSAGCACGNVDQGLREQAAAGTRIVGYRHAVLELQQISRAPAYAQVGARVRTTAATSVTAGKMDRQLSATSGEFIFRLVRNGQRWLVQEIDVHVDGQNS